MSATLEQPVQTPAPVTVTPEPNSAAQAQQVAAPKPENVATPRRGLGKRIVVWFAVLLVISGAGYLLFPTVQTALNTVSTDDAYVNGHVTFVAPRVSGQVSRVLVDDNQRVKRGDVLVQIDREPFEVKVSIAKAAVTAANADLVVAQAQVRGQAGQLRANKYSLDHAIESVQNQLAQLRSNVAQLKVEQANFDQAEKDYNRVKPLAGNGVITPQELDSYKAKLDVARNRVQSAADVTQQTRVGLGLPINHEDPLQIPGDLEQNYSLVRQALGTLVQSAAQIGYTPASWTMSPKESIEAFLKQDPAGNIDRIYGDMVKKAPAIKQAEARLLKAERDLDQAELDLRYCDVISEIDGVVTRRNVNPGNNVQAGQSLMAVRSLTEIWIDANFKETQLADLRIGQRATLEVDMYGRRKEFEGRITGFTMGTGQTLALLPPQNATGNYVKIVQRLPVRIELTDYNPDQDPLFIGLSVVPRVYFKEPATGPNAGKFLQPVTPTTEATQK